MNYDTITFDITDDIATVTLDRPEVMTRAQHADARRDYRCGA